MKVYAISDLHLDFKPNRAALDDLPSYPSDWLITGGDLCTKEPHLRDTLKVLTSKFAKVFWIPGNHELWSSRSEEDGRWYRGPAKYMRLVEICREFGVHTPEDPFITWSHGEDRAIIAPLFIGYDYTFRPDDVPVKDAVSWAMDGGVLCNDEKLIEPKPYKSLPDWCHSRLKYTRSRLEAIPKDIPIIMVNHFPFRQDMVILPRIPRFSIWCGTRETTDWHREFNTRVVISGHLHMPATYYRDGVRFEEVSFGYPREREYREEQHMVEYLTEILPGPKVEHPILDQGPKWRMTRRARVALR
jgi:3',5'-cyclic AMP phosphodiesterase CpdA